MKPRSFGVAAARRGLARFAAGLGAILALATGLAAETSESVSPIDWPLFRQAGELMDHGRYEEARTAYGRFLAQCPSEHTLFSRAAFERARCLLALGKTEDGVREMISVAQRYPDFADTPLALWFAVQYYLVEKPDKQQAWLYAEQIIQKYPQHLLAEHIKTFWPRIEKMTNAELAKQAKDIKAREKARKKESPRK